MRPHATPRAPKSHENRFSEFPCAGPYPSITGMKKLYWGEDAYVIRCGTYIYKVPQNVWERY